MRDLNDRMTGFIDRLVEAESRAASAETRAEMLQLQLDELKAGKVDEKKGGFWPRLFGRGR